MFEDPFHLNQCLNIFRVVNKRKIFNSLQCNLIMHILS